MLFIWLYFCAFLSYIAAQCNNVEEDTRLDTLSLIKKYGYEAEMHEVETEDGYILTMHRILPKGNDTEGKSPIILQHGLLCSSADWVIMGPNFSFGYILADAGYDVWLGNNRGNKYSRKHKSLDPNKNAEKYWDFSWNEMGKYDLPAEIDYVLSKTDQESLFYAGHSQGTTQFFVMGSLRPEYNKKIKLMGAFAPVAFMGRAPSLVLQFMSPLAYLADRVRKMIGVNEFLPSRGINTQAGELLCKDKAITQKVCSNFLFLMAGYDTKELNQTMLPVIMGHTPAGASTKQFLHYAQNCVMKNHFREWDYVLNNYKHYNRMTPPDYPLKNVNAPVALFYSNNDWMSAVSDVERLWKEITNVVSKIDVKNSEGKGYNHLDYLYGTHAPELVYKKYMELMEQHQ